MASGKLSTAILALALAAVGCATTSTATPNPTGPPTRAAPAAPVQRDATNEIERLRSAIVADPSDALDAVNYQTLTNYVGSGSQQESDPLSIHKDGSVAWTGNENGNQQQSTNW
jgi:hypothetical protein